jgi:hypothetical protein
MGAILIINRRSGNVLNKQASNPHPPLVVALYLYSCSVEICQTSIYSQNKS